MKQNNTTHITQPLLYSRLRVTSREILAKDRLEILWLFTPLIKSTKLGIENDRNTESQIYEVI